MAGDKEVIDFLLNSEEVQIDREQIEKLLIASSLEELANKKGIRGLDQVPNEVLVNIAKLIINNCHEDGEGYLNLTVRDSKSSRVRDILKSDYKVQIIKPYAQ